MSEAPQVSLQFVGNATLLIRCGDLTVLTDPNFLHRGQAAYLGKGLWSRRLTEPALSIEQLPPLSAVVLSHLHGDHFDRVAKRGLDRSAPILTTRAAARRLREIGFDAVALATWSSYDLTAGDTTLRVTALPGTHARGPLRPVLPPVMGSLLEFTSGDRTARVYLTGDTLLYEGLREIQERCPELDLAVLHLGGTKLLGLFTVTMDGRQGADLLELIRPRQAMPVHYDDYGVFRSPLSDFRAEVERRGLARRVAWVERGSTLSVPLR